MSYTTMNKFGEVSHKYCPGQAGEYVPGTWWPDFGPCSFDYSEQYKMHPTNTVFRNILAIPKERSDLLAKTIADQQVQQPVHRQFRTMPEREALYSSTHVPPHKKGGKPTDGRERHNYQAASVRLPPTMLKEHEAFTKHFTRSMSSPNMAGSTLPTSLVRLREDAASRGSGLGAAGGGGSGAGSTAGSLAGSMRSFGGASIGSRASGLPEFVAADTLYSRPPDAAGHAGTSKSAHCRVHAETGQPDASLRGGLNTMAASYDSRREARLKQWEALTNPHGGKA